MGMHFELVQCVCVVATGLSRSTKHQSFIADLMSPGQQAASEGGQVGLRIRHSVLVSGRHIDQQGYGKIIDS